MELDDRLDDSSAVIVSAPTPLGHVAVAVNNGQLVGVAFGHRSAASAVGALARRTNQSIDRARWASGDSEDHVLACEVLERLERYADGEPMTFNDIPVAMDHLSTFQRRVVKACRAIPSGEQRTYAEVAELAGSPGAARAVGQVMKCNRVPLVVPCHRVVASNGGLGGFSAPQGLAMKRRLLELESGALAGSGAP